MDKKFLVILIVALLAFLLAGIAAFKYFSAPGLNVQNTVGGAENQTPAPEESAPQIEIQAEGSNGTGTLSVCIDKCGDGICQKSDPNCQDDMNCVCPETSQECSQDCQ